MFVLWGTVQTRGGVIMVFIFNLSREFWSDSSNTIIYVIGMGVGEDCFTWWAAQSRADVSFMSQSLYDVVICSKLF